MSTDAPRLDAQPPTPSPPVEPDLIQTVGKARYALEPVETLLGGDTTTQAEHLGTSKRTINRWRAEGLSRDQAEAIADKVRSHVYELWPEMRADDIEEAERAEEERKAKRAAYRRAYYLANREKTLERQREADRRDREAKVKYARWYYRTHREDVLRRQRERDRARAERRRLLARLQAEQVPAADRHLHAMDRGEQAA